MSNDIAGGKISESINVSGGEISDCSSTDGKVNLDFDEQPTCQCDIDICEFGTHTRCDTGKAAGKRCFTVIMVENSEEDRTRRRY